MTALTAENVREVRQRGFTVVRGALDIEIAAELRDSLDAIANHQRHAATERTAIDDFMVHNPMVTDHRFLHLLENASIVSALNEFLGDTSILYAYTSSSMPARGTNYSHRIHVDSPRVIPGYMTNLGVIVALDDFTADNGATYYLPESFERTEAPSDQEFFASAERVFPKRGDLVVFNARTFHLGGQNTTNATRHAVTMNACRSFMRQRFDYPRLVDQTLVNELTPTLRRLLGFNVRVPASMAEYYLPEDQRLYRANQG